jgi:hypothetical protein
MASALQVKPQFARKGIAYPELGILKYRLDDGNVFIQMLQGGFDVSRREILKISESRHGITCYTKRRLRIESAIPIETLAKSGKSRTCQFRQRGVPEEI